MIMGNKCDMEDKRVVPTERGQEVIWFILFFFLNLFLVSLQFFTWSLKIARLNGIPFVETSAKTNINITRAFHDITSKILEKVKIILTFLLLCSLTENWFICSNQRKEPSNPMRQTRPTSEAMTSSRECRDLHAVDYLSLSLSLYLYLYLAHCPSFILAEAAKLFFIFIFI